MVFERLNLLEDQDLAKSRTIVEAADVVSLIYGFTELVRHAPVKAKAALAALSASIKDDALLLVADPRRSHRDFDQTNLADTAAGQGGLMLASALEIKVSVSKTFYEVSPYPETPP